MHGLCCTPVVAMAASCSTLLSRQAGRSLDPKPWPLPPLPCMNANVNINECIAFFFWTCERLPAITKIDQNSDQR